MKEFLYKKICTNCKALTRYSFGVGVILKDKIKTKCACGVKELAEEIKEFDTVSKISTTIKTSKVVI